MDELQMDHRVTAVEKLAGSNRHRLDDAKIALIESRCKINTQDGVTYLCNRNTGNPVYHPLSALVGLYVEAVSE